MTNHLLSGYQSIYSPRPPRKGDIVIQALKKSFKYKDGDAWRMAKANTQTLSIKQGEHIIQLRLEKAYVLKGSDLFLKFQKFEDFSDHFDFNRYYPIRKYTIYVVEDRVKQLSLENFI